MRRHPLIGLAPHGRDRVRRLACGIVATAALWALVAAGPAGGPPDPTEPRTGVERVSLGTPSPLTGTARIVINRPPAPVGDPNRAVDAEQVIEVAGPTATPEAEPGSDARPAPVHEWFLVGDSTFTAAAQHVGGGSAFPGVGFELAPFVGSPNPLLDPPAGFTGIVVIGVSIWDTAITDAGAYVAAVERYRSAGHPVLVIEVPEAFGPGAEIVTTEAERQELHALNRMVEGALGCPLASWTVRDVETSGDVDGGDDHVHPTAVGVAELFTNLEGVAQQICRAAPIGRLR